MRHMALKLPRYFYLLIEKPLVATPSLISDGKVQLGNTYSYERAKLSKLNEDNHQH